MRYTVMALLTLFSSLLFVACKEQEKVFDDPYTGGKPPLGIIVNRQQKTLPEAGGPGTIVSIAVQGLLPHKEMIQVLINGQKAEVTEITDKEIKVRIPDQASSGVVSFLVGDEIVFGPDFTVNGLVNKDFTFNAVNGANGPVHKIIELSGGNLLLLGGFTNYDNKGNIKPIRRMTRTLADGTWDRSFSPGTGANGTLNGLVTLGGFNYIAGSFTGYSQRGSGVSNITRVSTSGVIDTVQVTTYSGMSIMVPTFNGGVDATVRSIYTYNNKLIATGDFRYYLSRRYNTPNHKELDSTIIDSTDVRQLVRLNTDGTLDKTWRFDENAIGYQGRPGKSLPGGTGRLFSLMHADGKILAYGQFPKFDDVAVGYIIRLNENGTIDPTFNAGGAGADNYINHISYNETTGKYLAVGSFKTFNGKPGKNMVMLNYDGSVDESFVAKPFDSGTPNFIKQLSDGLILVGGSFKSYNGINRPGFLILNNKGEIVNGYNNTGMLAGTILDVLETRSADNKRALLIAGSFNLFNNKDAFNIVRVTLE